MPETSIPRQPDLAPPYDYGFLRAEGLQHIQRLSGLLWTDHNLHDPGITTLEILCYALTDLTYRARFSTVDLMTGPDGKMDPASLSGLVPAHEVLPTAPRTIHDYRRLLLRIEGLRNAWLDPMQDPAEPANYRLSEVPLYADCLADALGFEAKNAANQANHPVKLSGLYKVRVELEIDDLLGSLNETALLYRIRRGPLKGAVLSFDCADAALLAGAIDFSSDLSSLDSLSVSSTPAGFNATLNLSLQGGQPLTLQPCPIRVIEDRPRPDRPPLNITAQAIRGVLLAIAADDDLLPLFWRKQQRRAQSLQAVRCVLHAHRGLCEDFLSIATVIPWRIGICADIEVTADADLEEVQARVFHGIEKYLSAPVRYRSLEEMLREGRQADEIFNGPFIDFALTCNGKPVFTKPGFITDQDLANSEQRRKVQASDIINLVVDIDGVEAISSLQLRVYGSDGQPAGNAVKWTLEVPADHQPVFYMEGSKLLFHKAGIPYRAQVTEFQRTLDQLRALDRRELYVAPDQILPVPLGRWRNTDAFYSVQHDFPATYKIGAARISPTEDAGRIAQARQLKGYLTFFDQMLADYLGQLANLRRLYSLDKSLDRTWFSPRLSGIAGSLGDFDSEFFIDASLADDISRVRLNESEEAFLERRNRVLDHLIARFAERFADYALLSFRLSGDRLKTSDQLIDDKIDFLAEYPRQSRERGQAANLRPEEPARVWDSDNISGLERRAGRLLGIDDLRRRELHCAGHFDKLFRPLKSGSEFQAVIRDAGNKLLFASAETFADADAALAAAAAAYPGLREESALEVVETQGATTFTLRIVSGPTPLTHKNAFDTEAGAYQAARAIIDRYDEILASDLCNSEGMHLIEHILLRPQAKGDRLLQVCLGDDCAFCGEQDPYSFRVSVVLPYWPERFRDLNFRALLERTLREEAPAHVQVKICWIGQRQMIDLDRTYRAWLEARAAPRPDPLQIGDRTRALIDILESLTSVYPAASLHDCDAGEEQPIVRLGSTALGIF
ncbi:hypothetical protein ACFPU0_11470 [Pseudomonas sp. GCM10022186]|uniref:hypothetical protein n=1 Tax=Pseudomonas sp. GCM10022186 TaxID=3252650 RepID=UPI00361E2BF3